MELLGYLACIGLVLGVAQGCCLPLQWETTVGLVEGYAATTGSTRGSVSGQEVIHYDATGKRIASEAVLYNNGVRTSMKLIQLYAKGLQYLIQNNTCMVQKLGVFPQRCFDTTGAFTYNLGSPSNSIPVVSVMAQKNETYYSISLTPDNTGKCYYVGLLQSGTVNGVGYMLTEGFMNTTNGIKDKSVFNVPTICRRKNDKEIPKHVDEFYAEKSALNIFRL